MNVAVYGTEPRENTPKTGYPSGNMTIPHDGSTQSLRLFFHDIEDLWDRKEAPFDALQFQEGCTTKWYDEAYMLQIIALFDVDHSLSPIERFRYALSALICLSRMTLIPYFWANPPYAVPCRTIVAVGLTHMTTDEIRSVMRGIAGMDEVMQVLRDNELPTPYRHDTAHEPEQHSPSDRR